MNAFENECDLFLFWVIILLVLLCVYSGRKKISLDLVTLAPNSCKCEICIFSITIWLLKLKQTNCMLPNVLTSLLDLQLKKKKKADCLCCCIKIFRSWIFRVLVWPNSFYCKPTKWLWEALEMEWWIRCLPNPGGLMKQCGELRGVKTRSTRSLIFLSLWFHCKSLIDLTN